MDSSFLTEIIKNRSKNKNCASFDKKYSKKQDELCDNMRLLKE